MSPFAQAVIRQSEILEVERANRIAEVVTAVHDAPSVNGAGFRPVVPRPSIRFSPKDHNRDALESCLRDFMGKVSPATASAILADAIGDLITTGRWTEADARGVVYAADRRIDRVTR